MQRAQLLDTSRQEVTADENGTRRVPITTLPLLARALGTSIEDLIDEKTPRGPAKRGPAPKIQQQLEQLSQRRRHNSGWSANLSIRCCSNAPDKQTTVPTATRPAATRALLFVSHQEVNEEPLL